MQPFPKVQQIHEIPWLQEFQIKSWNIYQPSRSSHFALQFDHLDEYLH